MLILAHRKLERLGVALQAVLDPVVLVVGHGFPLSDKTTAESEFFETFSPRIKVVGGKSAGKTLNAPTGLGIIDSRP